MPLSPEIAAAINLHLPNEARASNVYQRLADDCRALGFEGLSAWLAKNSAEENSHLQKMIDYLSEWDVRATVPERAEDPLTDLSTVTDRLGYVRVVLQDVLALEESVTEQIEAITTQAKELGCWVGFAFLMDFIDEQSEGERFLRKLLRILPLYAGNLNDFDNMIGAA
jgi:ferritin